jgi:transcriptional regulator with XRE-family HTH domain
MKRKGRYLEKPASALVEAKSNQDIIQDKLTKVGVSKKLAKAIGLSSSRLIFYWYSQQKFPTYCTLQKVCRILNVDLKEVLVEDFL